MFEHFTKRDLIQECKKRGIRGYSNKNKAQLIGLLNVIKDNMYESKKVLDLIEECKKVGIKGYSNKRKKELIEMLINYHKNKSKKEQNACMNDIDLFSNKCEKKDNDLINKRREDIIIKMFNTDLCKQRPNLLPLKEQFIKIFQKCVPCVTMCDKFVLEQKGGRGNNYDFLVHAQRKMFTQHTIKVEFKYGENLFRYPQFMSIYITNKKFSVVDNDYVRFWYDRFLSEYLCLAHITTVPIYNEYIKNLNNTSYQTSYQKKIYEIMKEDPCLKKSLCAIADKSIQEYLSTLNIDNIKMDNIEKIIQKQADKIFIFCKNAKLSYYVFNNFELNKKKFNTTKNTLIFYSSDNKLRLDFLLRWKNYKGLSGPAWQIGVRKN